MSTTEFYILYFGLCTYKKVYIDTHLYLLLYNYTRSSNIYNKNTYAPFLMKKIYNPELEKKRREDLEIKRQRALVMLRTRSYAHVHAHTQTHT